MLQVHGRWRRVRSNSQPAEYVASEQSWLGMKAMRCNNYMSKPFANDCANWGGLKIAICGLICVGEVLVVHHSDFDVLIPSHSRIGKLSGGTRISMLLGTPG